ncbi:MAG: hypothetical protein KAZ14_02400 [Nitrosomonas sp.]|nr:hypothetical protein [Nitrosomonas sp.]
MFLSTTEKLLIGTSKLSDLLWDGTEMLEINALNGATKLVTNHQFQIPSATKVVDGFSVMRVKAVEFAIAAVRS